MRAAALAAAALAAPAACVERAAPRITIDLDTDPYHRWDAAIDQFKDAILTGIATVKTNPTYKIALAVAGPLMGNEAEMKKWYPDDMWREMQGIANRTGQSVGELAALSALYDLTAADGLSGKSCTGIVAQTTAGDIIHGRNLDYDPFLLPVMVNLTAVVDFQRGGKTLYTSVSYVFMPAFNTVMRPGAFTISHDERDQGSELYNFADVFLRRRVTTFAAIRKVAEEQATFEAAVAALSATPLSAPSYFVVGGTAAGEGAILTRGRDKLADTWRLDAASGRWYVLETNYDHWQAPGATDNRRAPAERMLNATGQAGMTPERMWAVMLNTDARPAEGERPTWNSMTVYSTVMQAQYPERLKVTIHDPPYPGPHPDPPASQRRQQ